MLIRYVIAFCALALMLPTLELRGSQARGWEAHFQPSVWFSNVDGISVLGDRQVEVTDSTLAVGGAFAVELKYRRWSFRLNGSRAAIGNPAPLVRRSDTTIISGRYRLRWTTIEGHVGLEIGPTSPLTSFAVYFGFRVVNQIQRLVDIVGVETQDNQVWFEPVEGVRYFVTLGSRFWAVISGDIGGFAVGSDFAWTLTGEGGMQILPALDLSVRYMYRETQYDNNEVGTKAYRWDSGVQQGWLIGLIWQIP